jgi:hypothetical protein
MPETPRDNEKYMKLIILALVHKSINKCRRIQTSVSKDFLVIVLNDAQTNHKTVNEHNAYTQHLLDTDICLT